MGHTQHNSLRLYYFFFTHDIHIETRHKIMNNNTKEHDTKRIIHNGIELNYVMNNKGHVFKLLKDGRIGAQASP